MSTIILNFTHKINVQALHNLELPENLQHLDLPNAEIIDIPVTIDREGDIPAQMLALVDTIKKSDGTRIDWDLDTLVVNNPGLSDAGAALQAIFHGKTGKFPLTLWLKRLPDGSFVPHKITNLQDARDTTRKTRYAQQEQQD